MVSALYIDAKTPSPNDTFETRRLADIAERLGVGVHELTELPYQGRADAAAPRPVDIHLKVPRIRPVAARQTQKPRRMRMVMVQALQHDDDAPPNHAAGVILKKTVGYYITVRGPVVCLPADERLEDERN